MKKLLSVLSLIGVMALSTACGNQATKSTSKGAQGEKSAEQAPEGAVGRPTVPPPSDEAMKAAEPYLVKGSPTVLVFVADWCPVCQEFKPRLEQIEKEIPDVKVVKLNIEKDKDLLQAMKVSSIPTMFMFDKDGKFVKSHNGTMSNPEVTKEFNDLKG